MRFYLLIFLMLLTCVSTAQAYFQTPGNLMERSPDGKYLRVQNKVMNTSTKGSTRDLTVYNFETGTKQTTRQVSPYGGFSPNHIFQAYSRHSRVRNKHIYNNEMVHLKSGRKTTVSDDHLILKVFDDGKILATKPGFDKYGNIKTQSGLYVFDPVSRSKTTILSKKSDVKKYLRFNQKFTDNLRYTYKLDKELLVHSLETGDKKSYQIPWPDIHIHGSKRLLEAGEAGAVIRVSYTANGETSWQDYYFNTQTEVCWPINDYTKADHKPFYELIDGKLHIINPETKVVEQFMIGADGLLVQNSRAFSSVNFRRDIKEYEFALASENRLAVLHFTDGLMQVIDLENDALLNETSLFRLRPETKVATTRPGVSAKPKKKVYKSVFLNSFDPLPLPYQLNYNTIRGRETTRPNGQNVAAIGLLGNTASGSLIVLMMRNYEAQGAEIINFEVAVYDEQSKLKGAKLVGYTSKDRSGVANRVDFTIDRRGQNVVFNVNQKTGRANQEYQVIIDQSGGVTRTQ